MNTHQAIQRLAINQQRMRLEEAGYKRSRCPFCHGDGAVECAKTTCRLPAKCHKCEGEGFIWSPPELSEMYLDASTQNISNSP